MTKYKKMLITMLALSVLLAVMINTAQAFWITKETYLGRETFCGQLCGVPDGTNLYWYKDFWLVERCWDDGTHCYQVTIRTVESYKWCAFC